MSRITQSFKNIKQEGRGACIVYTTVGFPELDSTPSLVMSLLDAGADMLELGIPFSDPLADGPTVQHASFRALENGVTRQKCFEVAREIRSHTEKPIIFMGYYNPIFSYGVEHYVKECAEVGVDGLIIPDLPLEEMDELLALCNTYGLDLIQFVAPTSTEERIKRVAEVATGFIYCVSITGVTGARADLPEYMGEYIARVRKYTDLPLVIGFGISRPEHFAQATRLADGAICASALLDQIDKVSADKAGATGAAFVKELIGVK